MIREHYAAIEAFLQAQGLDVYDTDVNTMPSQRYAVVYLDNGRRTSRRLGFNPQSHARFEFMVRSVGMDATQCRWVAERVARIVGHRLDVPGWSCRPVEAIYSGSPVRDDDLAVNITETVDGFAFDSAALESA